MSNTYMWQLTMPDDGSGPLLDAGPSVKDIDVDLFKILVGKTMVNLGSEMLSDVAIEFVQRNALEQQIPETPSLDEKDNVVYE